MPPSRLNILWQPDPTGRRGVKPREYEWICFLLSGFDLAHHMDGSFAATAPAPLVVLEGSDYDPDVVAGYLRQLSERFGPAGLIHVGDEFCYAPIERVYRKAAFVYRNYWRPGIGDDADWHYLPLGVNCRPDLFSPRPFAGRRHRWSFAGQNKLSRRKMIDILSRRTDGRLVVNEEFNSGLAKDAYARLLCDTRVVLCPRGWSSVDSYRLYEALEAGAVPLVEDDGGAGLRREHDRPQAWWNALRGGPRYWTDLARRTQAASYWESAFGPSFPCPRIYRWENFDAVLESIDTDVAAPAVRRWWADYKKKLIGRLSADIRTHLGVAPALPSRHASAPVS